MKPHTWLIILLCSIPAFSFGEGPTTKPFVARPAPPAFGPPGKGERPFPRLGPLRKEEPPTATELEQTEQFLKDNLPNRYALISELKPGTPIRGFVLDSMARRY